MNATRKPRQRRPHTRAVAVLIQPSEGQPDRLLKITQDGRAASYWLSQLVTDFGEGWRLEKPGYEGTESYDVLLAAEGDSCTCPGHTYGGYCKHQHPTKLWRWRRELYWGRLHKEGE
jgi:hypothetical protein